MEKKESLIARMERVLGRAPPDADPDEVQAEGSDAQQGMPSRRREQVLQAQRTHRHRTQQYIRELEKEVFHLRDENDELRQAMEQMRLQMQRMKAALDQNAIPFASELEGTERRPQDTTSSSSAIPGTSTQLTSAGSVSVDLTGLANVVPEGACQGHPAEIQPPPFQPGQQATSSMPSEVSSEVPRQDPELSAQLGINFVLALETPCLPHIKHAHMGYNTGTTPPGVLYNSGPGHLLTASAMLTHRYNSRDLEGSPLVLPSQEIEYLLEASGRLRLDGETTPVQIWARLRQLAVQGHENLSEQQIDRLLREFSQYVYCNSFGAVVETVTVEAVLAEVMESRSRR